MTDFKKVFIDTAPFIYFIEKNENNPQFFNSVKDFFDMCYKNDVEVVTSVITVEEYMVYPYRINSQQYIDMFDKLLSTMGTNVANIDKTIAKKAAKIRAEYKAFKAMDSLQLATAVLSGCDLFLTNDKQLRQFTEIHVITVDELGENGE